MDWTQGIALLATDAEHSVGRNRAGLSLYGPSRTPASRKQCAWRRFVSLAVSESGAETAPEVVADDWAPPDFLDEAAQIAATQLPIGMSMKGPSRDEIRSRLQGLDLGQNDIRASLQHLYIPYPDMLALLAGMMHVVKKSASDDAFAVTASWGPMSPNEEEDDYAAAAEAILDIGGIVRGRPIFFKEFFAFSEKFVSQSGLMLSHTWSFDLEIPGLWRALLSGSEAASAESRTAPHPPSHILRALEFLSPLPLDCHSPQRCWESTLSLWSSPENGSVRDEALEALTWPFSPKLVVVKGMLQSASSGPRSRGSKQDSAEDSPDLQSSQTAAFALLTSSPLWCTYKTGKIDDFFVDKEHLLVQLWPQPRALWYSNQQQTGFKDLARFADLVDTTDKTISLRAPVDGGQGASGITMDFESGIVTLASASSERGYVEIPVGPSEVPLEKLDGAQAWETVVRMQSVEVYSSPGGVAVGLAVKRPMRRSPRNLRQE